MPPKQAAKKNEPSKKTQDKAKQKVIEDKTFGLKNKKGAKQQKFINTVQKQVTYGHKSAREMDKLKEEQKNKKEMKKKETEELNQLFKPVVELQKCGKGVDPKSVLCVFFKQGMCGKGDKCKFSHDLGVARKTEKRSLYDDASGASGGDGSAGGMDTWDQAQLEEVVNKRHGDANKGLPPTAIICKYFLDAVESSKYGWFWKCPNGEKCHYRHALPPGFVLKKDKKKMAEQKEEVSLEELIEKERAALGPKQTPVTIESFLAWKKRKREEKKNKEDREKAKRKDEFARGRMLGVCGREVFEFNPDMVDDQDSDDEGVVDSYEREMNEEDEYEIHEINLNDFDERVNGDGTMNTDASSEAPLLGATAPVSLSNGGANDSECAGAIGGGNDADAAVSAALGAVALDEQLFLVDDDELTAMDDELDTLTLS